MPLDLGGNRVLTSGVTEHGNYIHRISRDGIRVYLDAYNTNSYQGGTSTWYDMSGYDNDCNWNSAPTWTSPGYFAFNGSTNYGTITMNSSLDTKEAQTLIMVLKRTASTKRENPWNQHYGGYGTWTAEIASTMNMFYGNHGANSTPYAQVTTGVLTDNQWYFVARTRAMDADRNGHQQYAYVNGVQTVYNRYSWGGPLGTDTGNISIGDGYTSNYTGHISMVLMYNRRLHPHEIAETFQSVRGRYGL